MLSVFKSAIITSIFIKEGVTMKTFLQKYKHAWVFLYGFIYLPWFYYLEKHVTKNYHVIHIALDDKLPFMEWFIIPYYWWFVLLVGVSIYTALFNKEVFFVFIVVEIITYCTSICEICQRKYPGYPGYWFYSLKIAWMACSSTSVILAGSTSWRSHRVTPGR